MNKYLALLEVINLKSFTKAGDKLGYSQSSISQMISQLEKEIGTKLLIRTKNKITLTSECEELLPYIEKMCEAQRELEMHIEVMGKSHGSLKIAAFQSVSCSYLPDILNQFKQLYPDINVSLNYQATYEEIETAILNEMVDLGFVIGERIERLELNIQTINLTIDPLMAVVSSSSHYARQRRFAEEALKNEPFLLLDEGKFNHVLDSLQKQGIRPKIKMTSHNDQVLLAMIEKNFGISILPQMILDQNNYNVVSLPLEPMMSRRIAFGYKSFSSLSKTAKLFINYASQNFNVNS